MLKHVLLVLFLGGIKLASCRPQRDAAEAREEITNDRIKKNEVVVNGPETTATRNEEILKNFRNPVLEYLLNKNSIRNDLPERKGIIRQIQHSQTLLIPNLMNGPNVLAGTLLNPFGGLETENNANEKDVKRDPEKTPLENFLNYVNNRPPASTMKEESSVTSPVLHLNGNPKEKGNQEEEDLTRIKIYPAVAVLINTFSKDGILKNSVTHYQPDFESMKNYVKEKEDLGTLLTQNKTINLEKNLNQVQKMHYSHHINNLSGNTQSQWSIEKEEKSQVHVDGETQETHEKINSGELRQQISWPFAQYFPIVINDPFLTAYNAITSSMYSAFSSMIEYGPEADICRSKDHSHKSVKIEDKKPAEETEKVEEVKVSTEATTLKPENEKIVQENMKPANSEMFDEIRLEAMKVNDKEKSDEKMEMDKIDEVKANTEVTLIMPGEDNKMDIKENMEPANSEIFDEVRLEAMKVNGKEKSNEKVEMDQIDEVKANTEVTIIMPGEDNRMDIKENMEPANPEIFDEVRLEAMKVNKDKEKMNEDVEVQAEVREELEDMKRNKEINFMQNESYRSKRDTTNIFMKIKNGGMIDINVEEPDIKSDLFNPNVQERSRSHSIQLVHTPPISTIVRPPFNGYFDKRKKPKPSKPNKEEGNEEASEEVGEEQEENSSEQTGGGEGVAISPPPEGASVAEAKPVGLAIAGPGGVAAAKPQGTAVAGPGGLAIARPVGTAIAGVEVEGSIPIGAQNKNKKKKPKQDPENEDLQYVGGLTGPIGNPQPKEFSDNSYFGGLKGLIGSPKSVSPEDLYFRGGYQPNGYQFRLGQHDGKYGFLPVMMTPVQRSDRLQKRMDNPTFFHGLIGNRNSQQAKVPIYPVMYY